jgi:dihydrodipicolinate synthase/N-acetylneuraminate lyase
MKRRVWRPDHAVAAPFVWFIFFASMAAASMYDGPTTLEKLQASVIAVPPLARHEDLRLHHAENFRLIRHLESGGVRTLLYGGNANLYNIALSEYAALLSMLTEAAAAETWVIPSLGPSYGMMIDQAKILREHAFPTAMVLPPAVASTPAGFATGIRKAVEIYGRPIVLYLKEEQLLDLEHVRRLVDDQLVSWIKYAVVREEPVRDIYLAGLVQAVDPRMVISGIGEQPAIVHRREFGVAGYTSGCVCIAPRLSMEMLQAILAEDWQRAEIIREQFAPLEALRNAISPIRVLHEAVGLAGIASTGPLLPHLSGIADEHRPAVHAAAVRLLAENARSFGDSAG